MDHMESIRCPAALPGWLVTTTQRECCRVLDASRRPVAVRYALDAENIVDDRAMMAEERLLAAERHAAIHEAVMDLPKSFQRLISLLIEDPPVPYAEISTRLGIPVGSIGPTRGRCLERLRRHPAIAALIKADPSPVGGRIFLGPLDKYTNPLGSMSQNLSATLERELR